MDAERAPVASATRMTGSFLEAPAVRLSAEVTGEVEGVCHCPSFGGVEGGEGSTVVCERRGRTSPCAKTEGAHNSCARRMALRNGARKMRTTQTLRGLVLGAHTARS